MALFYPTTNYQLGRAISMHNNSKVCVTLENFKPFSPSKKKKTPNWQWKHLYHALMPSRSLMKTLEGRESGKKERKGKKKRRESYNATYRFHYEWRCHERGMVGPVLYHLKHGVSCDLLGIHLETYFQMK